MPLLTYPRSRASKQLQAALKHRRPRREHPNTGSPIAIVGAALLLVAAAVLARRLLDAERREHLRTLLASVPIIENAARRGRA